MVIPALIRNMRKMKHTLCNLIDTVCCNWLVNRRIGDTSVDSKCAEDDDRGKKAEKTVGNELIHMNTMLINARVLHLITKCS